MSSATLGEGPIAVDECEHEGHAGRGVTPTATRAFADQRRQRRRAVVKDPRDRLGAAILASMSAHVAVLDRRGIIIAVNDAWTAFGRSRGLQAEDAISPGASYVAVCQRAAESGVRGAAETLAGVLAVCEGRRPSFRRQYAFEDGGSERWFVMQVVPLRRRDGGAVVTHRDVTKEKWAERELRDLSRRVITAQEDERRRIARDLHDDFQQRLALLQIELDGLAHASATLTADAVTRRARDLWSRTLEIGTALHQLAHRLHPSKLETLGLLGTLAGHCRELAQHGLRVTFSHDNVPASIPADVALCIFRVVQESLQNVSKHSGVTEAHVTISATGAALRVVVADNGRGFDVTTARTHAGLGLVGMRERVELVGGSMTIRSAADRGTSVQFSVPVSADGARRREGARHRTTQLHERDRPARGSSGVHPDVRVEDIAVVAHGIVDRRVADESRGFDVRG